MSAQALQWFKSTYSGDEGGQCLEVALTWHKSSYSSREGGACLEAAVAWQKSSYSGGEGGQCLEVAVSPGAVHIRDSKETPSQDRTLCVSAVTWDAFTSALK
ncbi:DUF397 domain-containing protein [Streptomyces sp. NPDC017095]|uniref:DUF397 domain-containing protein n=1 Tax=Streptomyces sp. NPDC017095 TaxID=3364977 RepID=UPI0037AFAD04